MALIWEKINGLLMTSAAANFPPAAPPRAGVSSSKLHRPRQGLLLTGHWWGGGGVAVRGEMGRYKNQEGPSLSSWDNSKNTDKITQG